MNRNFRSTYPGVLVCLALCWAVGCTGNSNSVVQESDNKQSKQSRHSKSGKLDTKIDTPTAEGSQVKQFDSFAELNEFRRAKNRAYSKRYRAANSDAERQEIFKTRPSVDIYLDQIEQFLREASHEEAAEIARWWWWGERGVRDGERIMDVLVEHHIDAEMLAKFIPRYTKRVVSPEKAEATFRTILKKNSIPEVLASATYSLHNLLVEKVETLEGDKAAATKAEIKSLRETLSTDFAEVNDLTGTLFVDRIAGQDFSAKLTVGSQVPDIVGKDLDGVEFKLSDYHGKVIVIDFWGDW